MSAVINLLNLKGGVGKTVSSINIAYSLAECGNKVLIADTDAQGNIATSMGVNGNELSITLADILSEAIDKDVSIKRITEAVISVGNVDILPSNSMLAGLDFKLMNAFGRETILKSITDKLRDTYDYIIIDCPPSLGLMVINALVASDYTLIPVEAHYLCFESLKIMLDTINMVKLKLNPKLEVAGIFLTMYQSRTSLSKGIKEMVNRTYVNSVKVFDDSIPYSVKAAEQTLYGKSIIELYPKHPISTAYKNISKELMKYGK